MKAFTRLKAQDTLRTLELNTEWHIIGIQWAISAELNANCMGDNSRQNWWPRSDAAAKRHLGGATAAIHPGIAPRNSRYQFQLLSMP